MYSAGLEHLMLLFFVRGEKEQFGGNPSEIRLRITKETSTLDFSSSKNLPDERILFKVNDTRDTGLLRPFDQSIFATIKGFSHRANLKTQVYVMVNNEFEVQI